MPYMCLGPLTTNKKLGGVCFQSHFVATCRKGCVQNVTFFVGGLDIAMLGSLVKCHNPPSRAYLIAMPPKSAKSPAKPKAAAKSQYGVYAAPRGLCFHVTEKCGGAHAVAILDAEDRGLVACGRCAVTNDGTPRPKAWETRDAGHVLPGIIFKASSKPKPKAKSSSSESKESKPRAGAGGGGSAGAGAPGAPKRGAAHAPPALEDDESYASGSADDEDEDNDVSGADYDSDASDDVPVSERMRLRAAAALHEGSVDLNLPSRSLVKRSPLNHPALPDSGPVRGTEHFVRGGVATSDFIFKALKKDEGWCQENSLCAGPVVVSSTERLYFVKPPSASSALKHQLEDAGYVVAHHESMVCPELRKQELSYLTGAELVMQLPYANDVFFCTCCASDL
jgi:hypothetical protein